MMQVILLERVEKLGQMGDVVNVRPGYARNYLLPKRKALRASEENRKRFEADREQLETANQERREAASSVAGGLDGLTVTLIRQAGKAGQLYGSVTARDIADIASTEGGTSIRRQQVWLNQPIKSIGLHEVTVSLHPEVTVEITVNVARSHEEAKIQVRTGRSAIGRDREEEEEVTIEEQAAEVFEEEVAEHVIEAVHAEEEAAAEEAAETKTPAPSGDDTSDETSSDKT